VLMKVPAGASVLPPVIVPNMEDYWIVMITSAGNMLIHPIDEIPIMPKGKGIKIINISAAKLKSRDEIATAVTVINDQDSIQISSGTRTKILSQDDMASFEGERAQRGHKLPQGLRAVERLIPIHDDEEEEET